MNFCCCLLLILVLHFHWSGHWDYWLVAGFLFVILLAVSWAYWAVSIRASLRYSNEFLSSFLSDYSWWPKIIIWAWSIWEEKVRSSDMRIAIFPHNFLKNGWRYPKWLFSNSKSFLASYIYLLYFSNRNRIYYQPKTNFIIITKVTFHIMFSSFLFGYLVAI